MQGGCCKVRIKKRNETANDSRKIDGGDVYIRPKLFTYTNN